MNVILVLIIAVVSLIIGVHGTRSLRRMLNLGRSYILFDWRRLFGGATEFKREDNAPLFWVVVVINAFMVTIAWSFAIGALVLFALSVIRIVLGTR
jgi:hypothetical protein